VAIRRKGVVPISTPAPIAAAAAMAKPMAQPRSVS
jgi:hypothetical protein